MNTPEFLSSVFYLQGNMVNLNGKADPRAMVVIDKVMESDSDDGPLNEPIATVQTDEKRCFELTLEGLKAGDKT